MLVGCLTSQQHASVSQGRICSDNFTCCHTEIKVAAPTFYLTQSQYTDTGPTSPTAGPITPGAWQGSHWSANFRVTGMTRPRKNPGSSGIRTRDLPLSRRNPYNQANEAIVEVVRRLRNFPNHERQRPSQYLLPEGKRSRGRKRPTFHLPGWGMTCDQPTPTSVSLGNNRLGTAGRRSRAHMGLAERLDVILSASSRLIRFYTSRDCS